MESVFNIKKSWFKNLYLASLVLIGLPPFFFLFSFLNLNSLAKGLWLIIFIAILFSVVKFKKSASLLLWLFVAFFITQSLSIFGAKNITAFLGQYEDLAATSLFVLASVYLIDSKKFIEKVIKVLIFVAFFNIFFQLLIFLTPDFFLSLGSVFLHQDYLELISLNIERGRIYFEAYDEALIPIVFYLVKERGMKKSIFPSIVGFLVGIISFISNFRSRFLMLTFSVIASVVTFFGLLKKKAALFYVFVAILFFILYQVAVGIFGFSVIERVALTDRAEDVSTITSRIQRWEKSTEIGLSSPIFGVGLGNYYDYLDPSMKSVLSIFEQKLKEFQFAAYYPHNMFFKAFAETGFVGLMTLIGIFLIFIYKDIKTLETRNDLSKAFIVSFWTIVLYSLFNPSFTTKFQVYFWLFRIFIEKSNVYIKEGR